MPQKFILPVLFTGKRLDAKVMTDSQGIKGSLPPNIRVGGEIINTGEMIINAQAMPSCHILTATDSTFELDVLKETLPVLCDFAADWCGPCKTMAPILEEIASEFAGKLKIVKCDAEENPETMKRYMVTSFPTFIFFKNGEVVTVRKGSTQKPVMIAEIERILRMFI